MSRAMKTGFPGELFAEPPGAEEKATDEEADNADGAGSREDRSAVEIEAANGAGGIEKGDSEGVGAVVESDQRKGAEGPEDESMGKAGEWALVDDFGLEEDFPDEVADALGDREEVEGRVFF